MSESLQELKVTLKKHGHSLTAARHTIFMALQDHEPQTMRAIIVACKDKADRASVYRTIALFEKLGIVQRLQIGWKYKLELSDAFSQHHHHLTCSKCSRTIALPEDTQLENRLRKLAGELHFHPQDHQIEIRGLCEMCAQLSR